MHKGWIGVDFDGTLAVFMGNGVVMGPPIPKMVERVRAWLREGREVRLFTARVSHKDEKKKALVIKALEKWCKEHLGQVIPITNEKDFNMLELYDDKAITVIKNSGLTLREYIRTKQRSPTSVTHTQQRVKRLFQ